MNVFTRNFICADFGVGTLEAPIPAPLLRKSFTLEKAPENASLLITGIGFYRLFINGGTVIAIGGRHSMPDKQSRQPSIQWRLDNLEAGKEYGIEDISSYKSDRTYQMGGATLLFSSPKLQAGKPYTLTIDGTEAERIESLSAPLSTAGNARRPMFR